MMNVREAFQLLKERGIARDKQELRKWLNEGFIQADPPVNRRVGWKISEDALNEFIHKYENGQFEELGKRRRSEEARVGLYSRSRITNVDRSDSDTYIIKLEEEVIHLRRQVRALRREFNDLKKVLGFPILNPELQDEAE
ncbi:hypothetical protein [Paenibacillus thermotolerans]|uniref:hypothetical protein n=1 Tax=Paenibacillus thermotolerans TaxID=3027807 RepID=UPI00236816A3|nr:MULTISPECIES: hypothetical protein [unclassified Paenibacillus]